MSDGASINSGDNELTLYGRWSYGPVVSLPITFAIIGGAVLLIIIFSVIVITRIKKTRKNKQNITKDDSKQTDVVKDSEQTVTEVNIIQTDADKDHDSAKK